MMEEKNREYNEIKDEGLDLRYFFDVVLSLKWWIVASVFVAMVIGYVCVRTAVPQYTRTATVLIANDRQSGGVLQMQLFSEITGVRANGLVHNEMAIMTSRPVMQAAVEELNLNIRYFSKNHHILTREMYRTSPIKFELLSASKTNVYPSIAVELEVKPDLQSYKIKELTFASTQEEARRPKRKEFKDKEYKFGDAINLPDNNVIVISKSGTGRALESKTYKVVHMSPKSCAKYYSLNLAVGTTDYKERSSVISLSMKDAIPSRADDILNTVIDKYNEDSKRYMSLSTTNTIEFIDDRLKIIETQLGDIESEVRSYRTQNTLVDFMYQSQATIMKGSEYEKKLSEIGIQLQFMDMIKEYMTKDGDDYSLLPANIGIADNGLATGIEEYNKAVIERRRLMLSASETNQRVQMLASQIIDLRNAILLSVNQLRDAYQLQYDEVMKKADQELARMSDIPAQQLDIAKIERQQKIVEPLYVLLRQKKEEALISLYAQTDNARIVDPADGPNIPTSPKPMMVYLLCFVLGIAAPPGYYFLRELLKRKVTSVKDVSDRTELPVLGTIPMVKDDTIVMQGNRDILSEKFRLIRANIAFLKGKVFQVTSSVSGEGKSTVAINIALSLAFAGKKVLLLETDLRNGFDYKHFDIGKPSKGLSTYLSGASDFEDVVYRDTGHKNLDVVFRGPASPNPNELLASSEMSDLVAAMREVYDYIILDSAPYVIISDPVVVNDYADATLYVVRCGVSDLRFIDEINEASRSKRLKHISIIVNSVDPHTKAYGKYGSYGSYGYGLDSKKDTD